MRAEHDGVVAVVGGGVIGLACAFELSERGVECVLIDPNPGHGASWAAAGMLSPAAEIAPGEEPLLADLRAAASMWPEFAARVASAGSTTIGFTRSSSLMVATNSSDARDVARSVMLMQRLGADIVPVGREELDGIEPSIAGRVRSAWLLPDDNRVDNRLLIEGLVAACKSQGVRFVEDRCVMIDMSRELVEVKLEAHGRLDAARCVLATGADVGIDGTKGLGVPPLRPVRGTTIRLSTTPDVAIPSRTIRGIVRGVHFYLVPREDGSVVIGATSEERGFAQVAPAGGIFRLLEAAREVVPGIDEMTFDEAAVGLRPATEDHVPFVGALRDVRVIAALGHYRNGILLAPLAGRRVAELLTS